jgi:hypothetical protein
VIGAAHRLIIKAIDDFKASRPGEDINRGTLALSAVLVGSDTGRGGGSEVGWLAVSLCAAFSFVLLLSRFLKKATRA